jgi:ADP-ribosylglycohydrolase
MTDDALISFNLVRDELRQRQETGYDVADLGTRLAATDPADRTSLLGLLEALESARRSEPWHYEEPDGLDEILDTVPAPSLEAPPHGGDLHDKVLGGWLGRIAGCNLGKPVEAGDHWTSAHLKDYLQRADAYPLLDYVPVLDPMPDGFVLRENWPQTTRGRINGSARDDDIDYAILGLHLLERHGAGLRTEHVAHAWLSLLPFEQVYTAERVAYRNLVLGKTDGDIATFRNPYREWIGAQIRGDAFGWIHPGDPRTAARQAFVDASLSHIGNGVYGEMWAAALVACAFTAETARDALTTSLDHVPPRSRLFEALQDVLSRFETGSTWEATLDSIQERYGHYGWVHTINNAALVAAGLLWGDGDYATSVGLTVQAGWDTDSNGATAGSVAGVLAGARRLPDTFITPLHDRTRSALFGFDNSRISDLAQRTIKIVEGR